MKAISTKTLLTFLTNEEESKRLSEVFRSIEKSKEKIYVSKYTVIELLYLLEKSLGLDRDKIYYIIKTILEDRLFKVGDQKILEEALDLYKNENKDFLEALKTLEYRRNGISDVM